MVQSTTTDIEPLTEEQQLLKRLAAGESLAFWSLFQQHRDHLLRCCLKWMNGNSTEAEDLLSQGMLKALKKAHKYADKIENFKSWITKLIRNYWLDLKRKRGLNSVEHIECYGDQEEGWISVQDSPASVLENDEQKSVICGAINQLPIRVRETFILHFYQELSHQEIAQKQAISYPNVCKRISQARAILREELRGYFIGEENLLVKSVLTLAVTELATEEISQQNNVEEVDTPVDERVTSSVGVAIAATVVAEEPIEVVRFQPPSELEAIATTSHAPLSIKNTAYSCIIPATESEWSLAAILAWAQVEEKTRIWDCLGSLMQWMQKPHPVRQWAEKYRRKIGSPPPSGFPANQSLIKSLSPMNIRENFPVRLTSSKGADFPDNIKSGPRLYAIGIGLGRGQIPGFLTPFVIGSKMLPLLKELSNLS
ncbi:sigma-70 family RNA polymerase sigma factor [Laspinema sp. D1]|uniref:RNA polymerase sigma factor n=1 Tax=Laspinema palackyanum TaxID=3231601 RepID=UPI003487237F|nr:sigma-70 family RNA polymerase sigma factor [Laspinema sp. D2b]